MQTSRLLSLSSNSPSFGSFSSAVDLAAIAARVVEELRDHEEPRSHEDNDDDFEFAFDCSSHRCSHHIATADEIFYNGQIRPLNPLGGGNVYVDGKRESEATFLPSPPRRRRPALGKLMREERNSTSNSSSEGDEDLASVPPESYCVWKPKQSNSGDSGDEDLHGLSSSSSKSKIKSNSAGFSKRWKLRNLLYVRSSSEGKEKLEFLTPVKNRERRETFSDQQEEEEESSLKEPNLGGGDEGKEEETKRQGYVPYKKDMIGILRQANGQNRHLHPF